MPTALSARTARDDGTRLAQLRAQQRRPHEASFFWFDTQLGCEAVKVLPGQWFVDADDGSGRELLIQTTLGSCIAACLWDRRARVGGLNHFMLPDGGDGGRYGAYAMELLINELMRRGAARVNLEAKVFGGGQVIAGMESMNIGARNTEFALDYLRDERIPVVSKDVLDVCPRKVCFFPVSGRAMVKRLNPARAAELAVQERVAPAPASAGGSVELF